MGDVLTADNLMIIDHVTRRTLFTRSSYLPCATDVPALATLANSW